MHSARDVTLPSYQIRSFDLSAAKLQLSPSLREDCYLTLRRNQNNSETLQTLLNEDQDVE